MPHTISNIINDSKIEIFNLISRLDFNKEESLFLVEKIYSMISLFPKRIIEKINYVYTNYKSDSPGAGTVLESIIHFDKYQLQIVTSYKDINYFFLFWIITENNKTIVNHNLYFTNVKYYQDCDLFKKLQLINFGPKQLECDIII